MEELKKRDQEEGEKQVIDPYTVKVRKLMQEISEADLQDMMSKFGEIQRCRIPIDEETKQNKGIGFITFKRSEDATLAVEEGRVKYEYFELPVEAATISKARAEQMKARK